MPRLKSRWQGFGTAESPASDRNQPKSSLPIRFPQRSKCLNVPLTPHQGLLIALQRSTDLKS